MWTVPTPKARPLVFRCPLSGIDVITNISIRDGDELIVAHGVFAVCCPCCGEQHNFCGYESRNVRRYTRRTAQASI